MDDELLKVEQVLLLEKFSFLADDALPSMEMTESV